MKMDKKEKTKKLHQFMYDWWSSFGEYKRCQACGKLLSMRFSTVNVDHLIPKSKRPDLAFTKDNLFLCCMDCHASKENGFPKEKHKLAIKKAKEKYEKI